MNIELSTSELIEETDPDLDRPDLPRVGIDLMTRIGVVELCRLIPLSKEKD